MKILFIEDNPMNRIVVGAMLRSADLSMSEAEDGERGLALIDSETFDLILVDLRMPGMDGLSVIRTVRARSDDKAEIPIIMVTADSAADLQQRCKAAGADALLLKPVSMDALFDAIGLALAARSLEAVLL
jgi:two-component system response regulator QseB